MSDWERIAGKIDSMQDDAIELMKNLIEIDSVGPKNDGPGEKGKAEYLKQYFKIHGFPEVINYPAPDTSVEDGERPNLVLKIPGKNTKRTLWIMSHTDVVPAGDLAKWDSPPFEAVVKDGRIFGRGSEDNLQGLVSSVIAARAFIETGIEPAVNIGLVLVADEESGSEFGLTWLLKEHGEIFSKDDLIIVPDAGEPDASMIEVAEKSIMWLKFRTEGKQVHASVPDRGINAFKAASNLVVALDDLHRLYPDRDEVFEPPVSTFEPTRKDANVPNVNTIPGEDIFYLDCRVLPHYRLDDVLSTVREKADDIEKRFGVKIEISHEQYEQAAPATPSDAEIVEYLRQGVKAVYAIEAKPMGIGGGTVAAIFRRAGYQAAVWATLDDTAHQPNEYCRINNLMRDAKVFGHCACNAK